MFKARPRNALLKVTNTKLGEEDVPKDAYNSPVLKEKLDLRFLSSALCTHTHTFFFICRILPGLVAQTVILALGKL